MFAGIVEAKARLLSATPKDQSLQVNLEKPEEYTDLKIGDSIAVNGICLTLEKLNDLEMTFTLGPETLRVIGESVESFSFDKVNAIRHEFNLERSLRFGDRVHGHLVTGHVDTIGQVVQINNLGDCRSIVVKVPENYSHYFWNKGSAAINGVSLTVNEVQNNQIHFCLIPETLKRSNLGTLAVGHKVTVEIDNLARAIVHLREGQS